MKPFIHHIKIILAVFLLMGSLPSMLFMHFGFDVKNLAPMLSAVIGPFIAIWMLFGVQEIKQTPKHIFDFKKQVIINRAWIIYAVSVAVNLFFLVMCIMS